MSVIIIPRRHYTQPQGRLGLAPEWAAGYTRGWTQSGILTLSAAGEYVATQHGVALRNAASGAGHEISQTYDSDWDWRGTLSYTVLSMFRIHSTPAAGDHPIVGSTTLANHWSQYIRYNGTSGFSIRDSALNTSVDYEIATGDTVICVSSRSSTGATRISYITLDQSAVSRFREGSSTADFYLRTANPVRLSGYAASATPLDILMFGMSRREWEHAGLLQNPWQIFRAEPVRIYSLPSGQDASLSAAGYTAATGAAQIAASIALAGVGVALASGSGTLSGGQAAYLAADGATAASGAAMPHVDIALSAIGLAVSTGAAAADAATAGSLAASGAASGAGTAAPVVSLTISAAGLARAAAAAGMSAELLLAGEGVARAAGNAALAAELAALAQGAAQASGSAVLAASAEGAALASGAAVASGGAALVLTARLDASGLARAEGAAGAAGLNVDVALTGAGFARAMGAGYLVVQIDLAGAGAARASGDATLLDATPRVLISMPRWRVDAVGRSWMVEAAGRN